ncbi:hypothetical protein [Pseudomonas aeruginosa]|uniref:hypothetical protein n=1 Tax=Pseudomonas aeruginosa TaxID=287 RepID=UPI001ADFD537|nr:hypothetical protein [Pseudomonas aeruginosa]ELP1402139.1 hypothetical protein [Pseudomonas aeruginosa]MCT4830591.1 hypothetical protein [Pseudomonas aeruginosa]MCV3976684.1 hypothetical protein [Pseudomonas aeruginosa]MDH0232588.1 hypothetical protein [Pseudomonas aeruginosa]MDI3571853.1 hypothetical protein [Pseudomonas aeruginosa]
MEHEHETADAPNDLPASPEVIGWGVASLVLTIIFLTVNTSAMVLGASLMLKLLAGLVGLITGWIGALVGNAVRKFAQPDAIYTNGGALHLIWLKVFWLIGPQIIGLIVGIGLGCSLVLR